MTVNEWLESLGDRWEAIKYWFISGQELLRAGEYGELTLGQASFTVFVILWVIYTVVSEIPRKKRLVFNSFGIE